MLIISICPAEILFTTSLLLYFFLLFNSVGISRNENTEQDDFAGLFKVSRVGLLLNMVEGGSQAALVVKGPLEALWTAEWSLGGLTPFGLRSLEGFSVFNRSRSAGWLL